MSLRSGRRDLLLFEYLISVRSSIAGCPSSMINTNIKKLKSQSRMNRREGVQMNRKYTAQHDEVGLVLVNNTLLDVCHSDGGGHQ
ncbi:hypothetical protein BD769DRAFT_1519617 [Suillus cothurnatus]|nr:hypothetical protein BD769DRAFT_1519617 [Suillus cothurnatus]